MTRSSHSSSYSSGDSCKRAAPNRGKIPVGISSCLLGEEVRYDGDHQLDPYLDRVLGQYFEFRRFCPEVAIGLGVPRTPIRLIATTAGVRCVNEVDPDRDVTRALSDCADSQSDWHRHLCGYILKRSSPSCGIEHVKLYKGQTYSREGQGIYAARLMRNFPELPVEDEERLVNPLIRAKFIAAVRVQYHRKYNPVC